VVRFHHSPSLLPLILISSSHFCLSGYLDVSVSPYSTIFNLLYPQVTRMSPSPTSSPVYFVYPCFSSLFQSFLCIIFTHSPLSLPNNLQVLLFPEIALSLYSVFPLSFLVLLYPQVTIHFMHGLSFPISTTVHFIYPFSSFLYQSFIYPYFSFLYKSSASFVRSLALFLPLSLCLACTSLPLPFLWVRFLVSASVLIPPS